MDLDWRQYAECAKQDPDLHHPVSHGRSASDIAQAREAKRVCQACPVREECLRWALARQEPSGVWGGLTERERRKILRSPIAPAA